VKTAAEGAGRPRDGRPADRAARPRARRRLGTRSRPSDFSAMQAWSVAGNHSCHVHDSRARRHLNALDNGPPTAPDSCRQQD